MQIVITQDPKHAGLHSRLTHHRPEDRLKHALLCLPAATTFCAFYDLCAALQASRRQLWRSSSHSWTEARAWQC